MLIHVQLQGTDHKAHCTTYIRNTSWLPAWPNICVYVHFAPRRHVKHDGKKEVSLPFTFTLRLSLSHQGLLARKTLDRNPKTRQERADLGLIPLRDERLNIGFRAE